MAISLATPSTSSLDQTVATSPGPREKQRVSSRVQAQPRERTDCGGNAHRGLGHSFHGRRDHWPHLTARPHTFMQHFLPLSPCQPRRRLLLAGTWEPASSRLTASAVSDRLEFPLQPSVLRPSSSGPPPPQTASEGSRGAGPGSWGCSVLSPSIGQEAGWAGVGVRPGLAGPRAGAARCSPHPPRPPPGAWWGPPSELPQDPVPTHPVPDTHGCASGI